ncbi:MAG: protein translocase subunit SecF [Caulobacteraceae bacterium]|nr:protein translocase subunit SecF [Caulobacteraceae bacterium]
MEIHAPDPIDIEHLRDALHPLDTREIQVQGFQDPHNAMVRLRRMNIEKATSSIRSSARAIWALCRGARHPKRLARKSRASSSSALISLGLAMILVMGYIWLRFDFQFGVGAILSLFHDAILTLGVFSFFRIEFTLPVIAALLTVIGYSMNDTVVVFDRMRENFRKYKTMPPPEVIDLSINETLSRTLMTIGTVLIASAALYIWGGETMRAFAICMLFGTVVATYSSIYIAAPALPLVGERPGRPTKPKSGLMARGSASE